MSDGPENESDLTPRFYLVVAVSTLLGVAHHVDHLVRGNHVGWPVSPDVNPFTYSLLIYPLIALGLFLALSGRRAAGYWTVFSALSAMMLAFLHLSPWAVEPPGDVVLPYANPVFGYAAFAVLVGLVAAVSLAAVYAFVLWRRSNA